MPYPIHFKHALLILFVICFAVLCVGSTANAQTVQDGVVVYQGELSNGDLPAEGLYDFEFKLLDANGNQVSAPLVKEDVEVLNGLFYVELDFGVTLTDGASYGVAVAVRDGASTTAFTPVTTASPQLVEAANRSATGSDASLNGQASGEMQQPLATSAIVYGSAATAPANAVYVAANGYTGVGITTPLAKLHVTGHLILNSGGNANLFVGTGTAELNRYLQLINSPQYGTAARLKTGGLLVADSYAYANPAKNNLIVKGRVGISTTVPTATLDVGGNVLISNAFPSGSSGLPTLNVSQQAGGPIARFISGGPSASLFLQNQGGVSHRVELINQLGGRFGVMVGGGNEALSVMPNGFVGIHNSAPNANLDITGNIVIANTSPSGSSALPTLNVSQQAGGIVGRLVSSGTSAGLLLKDGTANNDGVQLRNQGGNFSVVVTGGTPALNVTSGGLVGINTPSPSLPLHVVAGSAAVAAFQSTTPNSVLRLLNSGGEDRFVQLGNLNGRFGVRVTGGPENGEVFNISRDGNVAIGKIEADAGAMLDVAGTTRTNVLMIDAGGDLAEPFDINSTDTIEPGMVVAIDPDNPGQLRLADAAYDRTVAGVVSGAGGINPGLILQQEGSVAAGEHPVALTGRVYVYADASNGPIVPGDLLTTSDTPGHAMKVTDYERAQGAILGKAMSRLEEGTGLVLVLVTLQ